MAQIERRGLTERNAAAIFILCSKYSGYYSTCGLSLHDKSSLCGDDSREFWRRCHASHASHASQGSS
jgi:hypothetical protein